mmetsp:Transcript_14303/g.19563  ORF Transcript_14303/g.19563 Transcript_14303/m.19563 type:complete len:90 (-) Transcript_14303:904-1173(-)
MFVLGLDFSILMMVSKTLAGMRALKLSDFDLAPSLGLGSIGTVFSRLSWDGVQSNPPITYALALMPEHVVYWFQMRDFIVKIPALAINV